MTINPNDKVDPVSTNVENPLDATEPIPPNIASPFDAVEPLPVSDGEWNAADAFDDDLNDPPKKKHRKWSIVAVAAIAVAAICGGAAFAATHPSAPASQPNQPVNQTANKVVSSDPQKQSAIKLTVKAQGATESATTAAKVTAVDKNNKEVIKEFEVPANKETEIGKLDPGTYELHLVRPPVNEGGSTYKGPDNPQSFTVEKSGEPTIVTLELTLVEASDMTKEQLDEAAAVLAENGKTEAAQTVADNTANAAPNGNTSGDTGSSNNNAGTFGGGSDSSNGGGGATTPPAPSHTHNWVAQYQHYDAVYETQWVPNWVWVSQYTCGTCGAKFSTPEEAVQHQRNNGWSDNPCGAYGTTSYQEDQGSNQSVLVSPASDVLTGYQCSGCGAWQ